MSTNPFIINKYYQWYNNIINSAKSKCQEPNCYYERHHIIPKCLGGNDDESNMVSLTAREHFICHRLLTKFTVGKAKWQMQKAANMMLVVNQRQNRIKVNGKLYAHLKQESTKAHSLLTKGKPKHSVESRRKISEAAKGRVSPFKGKTHSEEWRKKHSNDLKERYANGDLTVSLEIRDKISKANTGQKRSEETKRKMSEASKHREYPPISDDHKLKISKALKGRPSALKGRPSSQKGSKRSAETKANMSASHQNREKLTCQHCGKQVPKPNYARWHGDQCKEFSN